MPDGCCARTARDLRLVDTQRTYSRAYLQFDLERTAHHSPTFAVLWALLREEAFRCDPGQAPLIHEIIRSSARHGQAVSRSLRVGVIEAVQHLLGGLNQCGRHDLPQLFDESLTVVYRMLFLMFAESRGLVPNWHPIYRDSYTVESLRERVERPGRVPGLWEALQAIARLAHAGCRAGSLVVPPFNGRLFSPARAPIAESCAVDDEVARGALLALSTTTAIRTSGTSARRSPQALANRLPRPRRRAARRCLRERARLRARLRRIRIASGFCCGEAETSANPPARSTRHRRSPTMSVQAHAASAGRRRDSRSHSAAPRRWIPRWAARRFSSRHADISRAPTSAR